jgi:hypothetical protein
MDLGFSAADLAVREEVRSFLATERPLYGNESPEPIGSKHATGDADLFQQPRLDDLRRVE